MEEKLVELETRYSFQEDLLQKLNEIVTDQQNQLDKQSKQLQFIHNQLTELRDAVQSHSVDPDGEKPPHY